MTVAVTEYFTTEGDVIDAILVQQYGQCPGYLLRQVWEMNPVLLDHEDHLPAGLTLWLPVIELSNEVQEEQLWD